MRTFPTGATRDSEEGKLDYEGFFSPLVLHRLAQYMHKHRTQKDGTLRDSDNWKRGIPIKRYMKGKWRHFMDTWFHYSLSSHLAESEDIEESLCAELFNTAGMLHEVLKEKE